jgi:predicted dehydrogenase
MLNFGLIGDGQIAAMHRHAIASLGHKIIRVYDPLQHHELTLSDEFFDGLDWVAICSPSNMHYKHVRLSLKHNVNIICEKPLFLPWHKLIDDDKINIVLQYRWADLPDEIDLIRVCMVRGKEYFKTWKGNPLNTGGLFYNLFIHYIDLAINHNSRFVGKVVDNGINERFADDIDLFSFDMKDLYVKMYTDTINGSGIKPTDIMFLMWFLDRQSNMYGFGTDVLNRQIEIPRSLIGPSL